MDTMIEVSTARNVSVNVLIAGICLDVCDSMFRVDTNSSRTDLYEAAVASVPQHILISYILVFSSPSQVLHL